ncbi:MAG: lysophospholipid acyltransferase family protein [Polyangiales bacterium]
MTKFERPSEKDLRIAIKLLEPFAKLVRPLFFGLERVPADRPLLFVGNHTLFGVLDVPFLFAKLWEEHGIFLRALGDHVHFSVPIWGDLLKRFGVVDGTRENCAALMEAGETILVFPGGAREVAKRKGEQNQLLWKDRMGFARMAVQHRCTIVPFAAIGVDDSFEIVADADDFFRTPVGKLAKSLGLREDFVPPLARPDPLPERFYFRIGEPIAPMDDPAALRDRTRKAIEEGMAALLRFRDQDPKRQIVPTLARKKTPRPSTR